jgi:hypothetical protein
MDEALAPFLLSLAIDLRMRAEYEQDPAAFLERSGLSDEARRAILNGDRERLSLLAGAPVGPAGIVLNTKIKGSKIRKRPRPRRRPPAKRPRRKKRPNR